MATYGCIFVFFGLSHSIYDIFTPMRLKLLIIITVFAFTFLLPVLNLFILRKLRFVKSIQVDDRQERTLPFIMTSLCYLGLFYVLYDFSIWPAIKLFILGAGLAIFITAIINIWWKISAHMIGIGGLIGVLFALGFFMQISIFMVLSFSLFIAGIIGFARLALNAHNQSQVYIGFFMGFLIQFGLFSLAHSVTFL